jgi:non-structural maintenance of chromosomes element 4
MRLVAPIHIHIRVPIYSPAVRTRLHLTPCSSLLLQVPRYDAIRLSTKLKQKLSTRGTFDWKKLGAEVGVCFNALPSNITFLAGPLNTDYTPKERKKPERRQKTSDSDNEEEEQKPEDVKNQQKDADKLSAVEQNIQTVSDVLMKRCAQEHKRIAEQLDLDDLEPSKRQRVGEIGAIEYLFNPKSFTQTVENIFHFSFLLKDGRACIYNTDDKGPVVQPHPHVADHPPPRQCIISFNMRDWRRLTETYQVEKSLIPHRTGSKHSARLPSSSQSVAS